MIERTMTAAFASGPASAGPDRLIDRMPPEQAGKAFTEVISLMREDITAEREARKDRTDLVKTRDTRVFRLIVGVGAAAFVLVCWTLFSGKDDLAKQLITHAVTIVGGGLGGYGYARSRKR